MLTLGKMRTTRIAALALTVLAAACSRQAVQPGVSGSSTAAAHLDFSGSWLLDYAASDDLAEELRNQFRRINRAFNGRSVPRDPRVPGAVIGGAGGAEEMVAVARLTELITRSATLEIAHTADDIAVRREDEYTLSCRFDGSRVVETPLGTELCGWDGHQMIFHVGLPDGLSVSHRMTLAPDRQRLHVATTVISTAAPAPFTLSRIYDRFEPQAPEYQCEDTLTRNRVCSASGEGL